MVTADLRALLALVRWAHANGWTHTRKPAPRRCGNTHTWRRDNFLVALTCSWADGLDSNGQPLPPMVSVWDCVNPDVDDDADILRFDAISVARVIRVLTAVDVLPAGWRRTVTRRPVRQLRGQLELIP